MLRTKLLPQKWKVRNLWVKTSIDETSWRNQTWKMEVKIEGCVIQTDHYLHWWNKRVVGYGEISCLRPNARDILYIIVVVSLNLESLLNQFMLYWRWWNLQFSQRLKKRTNVSVKTCENQYRKYRDCNKFYMEILHNCIIRSITRITRLNMVLYVADGGNDTDLDDSILLYSCYEPLTSS